MLCTRVREARRDVAAASRAGEPWRRVEFTGAFCMEQCSMGVSVRVGDRVYCSVQLENVESFFYDEVMPRVSAAAAAAAVEVAR